MTQYDIIMKRGDYMRKNITILILYVLGMFAALGPYVLMEQLFSLEDPYQIVAFISTYATILLFLGYFIFKKLKKDFLPFFHSFWKIFLKGFQVLLQADLPVEILLYLD